MNMRQLSAFEAAALGVDTRAPKAGKGLQSNSLIGVADAPAVELSNTFKFQSYFDSTLLQRALIQQPQNSQIVPSTMSQPVQLSGYGIGLHPSSETPIAIQFGTGDQQGGSQVYRIVPGQVIRPFGVPLSGQPGSFSSFQWGLPFGWLGGGSALLVILRTPDAQVNWNSAPEIVFHRQRSKILTPATLPDPAVTTTFPFNWPKRFPWSQAIFSNSTNTTSLTQRGAAALAVSPTRVAMRLRLSTLAAAADMRCIFYGTNDFDLDSAGAVVTTDQGYVDMTWGTTAVLAGSVNLTAQYQTQVLTGQLERFAADDGAVILVSDNATIQGQYVDIVRYGRL